MNGDALTEDGLVGRLVLWTLLSRPNEPWDIALNGGASNYDDPGEYIGELPASDLSHLGDANLNRRIRAASRLSGPARAQAYAKLDLTLTRDIVPRINYGNAINQNFFSARIGCQLYQPVEGIDLAALCIRTRHGTGDKAHRLP